MDDLRNFNFARIIRKRADLQDIYLRREERVKREGSPFYTYILPVTATTAYVEVDVQKNWPDSRKYEPLDDMVIKNNDVQDLQIDLNGDHTNFDIIMAGEMSHYKDKAIWNFRITNIGAADTVLNKVVVILQRSSTSQDAEVRAKYGQR